MNVPVLSKQQVGLLVRASLACYGIRLRGAQVRTANSLRSLGLGRVKTRRRVRTPDVLFFYANKSGRRAALHVLAAMAEKGSPGPLRTAA